ncbi:MAG: DUF6607 family protein [Halospina sp.]
MLRPVVRLLLVAVLFLMSTNAVLALEQESGAKDCELRYVFSRVMDKCPQSTRGGTSEGAPVTLAETPTEQWEKLRDPDLDRKERDRRAILAMAGKYRADFEFLETQSFPPDYELARPYHSWATEKVHVNANEEDFISLQHIMVMYYQKEGETHGPVVMKHWRQDWHYEDTSILQYRGKGVWQPQELEPDEVEGTWSQTVYQVDDSPRYASFGRWEHNGSFSRWTSENTWRPLPRREHSVRSDYDVLEGVNRHIITPSGWYHEQDNLKLRLDAPGEPADSPYLAREQGLNQYTPIRDVSFEAGDEYWEESAAFWAEVRAEWRRVIREHDRFRLNREHEGDHLFQAMFELADRFRDGEFGKEEARERVRDQLAAHVD